MSKEKPIKTNAMRILDRMRIPYTLHPYACEAFQDGVQVAHLLGRDPATVFKTLVAVGKSRNHLVFVLPVAQELDLKKAAHAAGEKAVTLIPVQKLQPLTGYIRGGCTAIGMKKPFPVWVDASILLLPKVLVSGGQRGVQLELTPEDYLRACQGQVADLLSGH